MSTATPKGRRVRVQRVLLFALVEVVILVALLYKFGVLGQ